MMNFIIANYIKNLTFNDFNNLINNQNINASDEFKKHCFNLLKNNYQDIIKNPLNYLNLLKNNLSVNDYNKVYTLYTTYSKKLYH